MNSDTPKTAGEMLESAGYDQTTATASPGRTIQQKGVKEELVKLGFDPQTAREVVGEILIAGENDTVKLKAADMVFKVHGEYAAEKHVNVNVEVEATDKIKEAAKILNDLHRTGSIGSDGITPVALGTETPNKE